jgi:hypothetical protein
MRKPHYRLHCAILRGGLHRGLQWLIRREFGPNFSTATQWSRHPYIVFRKARSI